MWRPRFEEEHTDEEMCPPSPLPTVLAHSASLPSLIPTPEHLVSWLCCEEGWQLEPEVSRGEVREEGEVPKAGL